MRTHRNPELIIMARAFTMTMGRTFSDDRSAKVGDWYLERADTDKSLWRLAERLEHGAVSHPVTSAALAPQALADALYFARLAVGMDRQRALESAWRLRNSSASRVLA